jgi:hypothetical protein
MRTDQKIPDPINEVRQADIRVELERAFERATASLRASAEAAKSLELEKRIEVWLTAQRRLLPILAGRGWVPSMHMVPRDMVELLDIYKDQGGEALDRRMVHLGGPDSLRSIASSTTGVFAAWGPVFSKALRAHESGDYELAIPIWLLAIEGIVKVTLDQPRLFATVRQKKVRSRVADRLRIDGSLFSEFSDAWVSAFFTVANPTEHAEPAILNRNAVLHGQLPRIGTQRDSVQGMLFLDLFKFLLDAADRRKVGGATFRHPRSH